MFENLTKEEACRIEILLIALFNTQNPDFGYNISPGGDLGFTGCHLSEEAKQKLSESHIGKFAGENNPMYGISPKERMDEETYIEWKQKVINFNKSEESRKRRREKNLGKKYSDEINKKKGRKGSEHPMYGKHHTEETKEKIRQGNLGKKESEETRQKKKAAMTGDTLEKMKLNQPNRIPVMYVKTGQIFNSISEASRQLGISYKIIRKCLNGTYTHYNFIKINKEDILNGVNDTCV